MKLEAVTSRSYPSPQGFPSKDVSLETDLNSVKGFLFLLFLTSQLSSFSLVNKHLTWPEYRLVHNPHGSSVGDPHQNGYTCKLVAALKEQHDFTRIHNRQQ